MRGQNRGVGRATMKHERDCDQDEGGNVIPNAYYRDTTSTCLKSTRGAKFQI